MRVFIASHVVNLDHALKRIRGAHLVLVVVPQITGALFVIYRLFWLEAIAIDCNHERPLNRQRNDSRHLAPASRRAVDFLRRDYMQVELGATLAPMAIPARLRACRKMANRTLPQAARGAVDVSLIVGKRLLDHMILSR